jgi:hypothetical protein
VLAHEELSDEHTLQLETQLSSLEDELVFPQIDEAGIGLPTASRRISAHLFEQQ